MKNSDVPKTFLGMEIRRDRVKRALTLNQSEYIEKILERFGMKVYCDETVEK